MRHRVLTFAIIQVFLICRYLALGLNPAGLILQFNVELVRHNVSYDTFLGGFHSFCYIIDIKSVLSL